MILTLIRTRSTHIYTAGKLFIDGKFECFTLEDPYREKKIKGETRIPSGSFEVWLRYSPKFTPRLGHNTLWLKSVPNFDYVLIHPGNKTTDTEGCILVGKKEEAGNLYNSRAAYFALYDKVKGAAENKTLFLTIIDL